MSVVHERARFTVLSPRVLRMEWGSFLDLPTLAFPFCVPSQREHSHTTADGVLTLKVGESIELTYKSSQKGRKKISDG